MRGTVVLFLGDALEDGLRQFGQVIQAFPKENVRQFDMIGRRRADESLRRTGVLLRTPAPDEGATTSYTLPGQTEEQKTSCPYMGIAGKPPIGRKSPGSYLIIDESSVKAVSLSRNPETRELVIGDLTLDTTPDKPEEIDAWAQKNPGIVRLFATQPDLTKQLPDRTARNYSDTHTDLSPYLEDIPDNHSAANAVKQKALENPFIVLLDG